ncbi:MAG: sirohydrochlorin cobaltochelatase [Thermodesulfobacteriota bacterium]
MKIPIVVTAFGTTTKARATYELMDRSFRKAFPGHDIHWAFSSRMVKDKLKGRRHLDVRHTFEVLAGLRAQRHSWAVVQSLHLMCGHEFYRLLEEVKPLPIRTSIGLPLLSSYEDYHQLALALGVGRTFSREEALVLVGHGTDHPSWSTYPALEKILREAYGPGIYVGVVEGYPSKEQVIKAVIRTGARKVRLIPLMLVAGVHFYEDLNDGEDSWRAAFEAAGLEVNVDPQGIGAREEIIQIFIEHIREALDVIPKSDGKAIFDVLENHQQEMPVPMPETGKTV